MRLKYVGGASGVEVIDWIPACDLADENASAYAAQYGGLDALLATGIYVLEFENPVDEPTGKTLAGQKGD